MHLHKQRGFTLIELLIVIAIIGIIASIVIPQLKTSSTPQSGAAQQGNTPSPHGAIKIVGSWPPIDGDSVGVQTEAMLRRNYYVILDGSGSMKDAGCSGGLPKFDSAVQALNRFFSNVPDTDNIGLLVFDTKGLSERVPLGINNREQLRQALSNSRPYGGTPLSRAVEVGYESLTRQATKQLGYGEFHMVIVTDGDASEGYDPTYDVNQVIDNTAIIIHTIGYCIGSGHSLNQPGRTLYSSADSTQSLSQKLHAVLAEAETFDVSQFQ